MDLAWYLVSALLISNYIAAAMDPVDITYYNLLQVPATATQQEIRQAYKKLAIKLHPDKNSEQNMQDKFMKVSEAYETLKDPEKRTQYDLHGAHPTYARRYGTHSQSEYNNLFFNGLYAGDKFVDNVSGTTYFNYLTEGYHFINFYSPFCPPCQTLSDDWKKLAQNFKGLVKVAAVNCKYQSDFCYNVMRIASYPSLLFYQNGKDRHFTVYRGDRSYQSLEKFVMDYIETEVRITSDKIYPPSEQPTAYIFGESWLHKYTEVKIALNLKGLVRVVKINDEHLRKRLTSDEYITVVLEIDGHYHYISSTGEEDILSAVTDALPTLQPITTNKLANIRNNLRSNTEEKLWVIYFSADDKTDILLGQKLKQKFPNIEFGEVNCNELVQLCLSLQVDEPRVWAIMKAGGTYERFHGRNSFQDISQFIERAKDTENVQTLSISEFTRIIDGDGGAWIVAVVPYKMSWDHMVDAFTKASHRFKNIQFGVMMCQQTSARYCNPIALNTPVVIVQNKTIRFTYREQQTTDSLEEFIENVMHTSGIDFTESKFHEVLDRRSANFSWAVAFFPQFCDDNCQQLKYEWKIVTRKLIPVSYIKTGSLHCSGSNKRFCDQSNVRSPILRLYPASSSKSYVAHLLNFNRAAYMLEWLLGTLDDTIEQLTTSNFANTVLADSTSSYLEKSKKPWMVYFHSPRCYHCYEMFTDFFITAMMLKSKVKFGKVNCLREREICNDEQIMSYPSIKFYTNGFSDGITRSISFVPKHFEALMKELEPHLIDMDTIIANNLGKISLDQATTRFQHDEF